MDDGVIDRRTDGVADAVAAAGVGVGAWALRTAKGRRSINKQIRAGQRVAGARIPTQDAENWGGIAAPRAAEAVRRGRDLREFQEPMVTEKGEVQKKMKIRG